MQQSHFFSKNTLASDDVSSDQLWLPRNQQFRKYSRKSHSLIIPVLAVTLTLKIATMTKFCMTLWLMILHNHTISGSKMFCDSENIIQTFTDILNLRCAFGLKCSNPIFPQDTPAYDTLLSSQVWLQTDQQLRRYNRISHILITKPLAVTLTLNTVNQFFCLILLAYDAT